MTTNKHEIARLQEAIEEREDSIRFMRGRIAELERDENSVKAVEVVPVNERPSGTNQLSLFQ